MKTINKLSIFCAFFALLAFVGCSTDEADYTSAKTPEGAQVYFSSALSSTIELSKEGALFMVEVRRINTTEELTVSLTAEDESGLFGIPSSVTFAAEASVASFMITYDSDNFEYDEYKKVTLSIADEEYVTPYGASSYTFKAGVPAPWESLGIGTFTDNFLFEETYEVEIQRNTLNMNQYRVVDPFVIAWEEEGYIPEVTPDNIVFEVLPAGSLYKNVTTTIDGLVAYDDICTGYTNTNYNDVIYYVHPSRFTSLATEDYWTYNVVKQGSSSNPEVVQLAPYAYMFSVGGWNYTQVDDVITIVFPGVEVADYSTAVSYLGIFVQANGDEYAVGNATLGDDVASAKAAMVSGNNIDAAIAGMLDETISTIDITSGVDFKFAVSDEGTYSFVVLTYNAAGEQKGSGYATFNYTPTTAVNPWETIGMAEYTDDYMTLFGLSVETYEVPIQENTETPGMYRLVQPYHYHPGIGLSSDFEHYININAVDQTRVYITEGRTGIGDQTLGEMYTYSIAAYYLDNGVSADVVANNGYFGTLSNGVITFPTNALGALFPEVGEVYYANQNGAFKVVLPTATTSSTSFSTDYAIYNRPFVTYSANKKKKVVTRKDLSNVQFSNATLLK